MPRKKQQNSNIVGLAILGLLGLGITYFGILPNTDRPTASAPATTRTATTAPSAAPLSQPRYVSVASLNVRHTPSPTGPLIGTLPQGTPLKVLDRQNGWLLVDLSPTLEGWVTEQFTTTRAPEAAYVPPAGLRSER